MHRKLLKNSYLILLGLLLFVLTAPLGAQTISGYIAGTVVDPVHAAVPGATVTLLETEKKYSFNVKSESDGRFVFAQVPPGTYKLTVTAQGFKEFAQGGIVLNANDRLALGDLVMQIGAITEHVEVSAATVTLQTESAERSEALVFKQIDNIAVNSRSPLDLVKLVPGVVSTVNLQTAGPGGLSNISANGARVNSNQVTINGIGNTDTGSNGSVNVSVSLDSIEEFKILTGVYQAEYGRAMGAQINLVTKSGTRDLHGSGYFQHRNDSLNANNWKNNRDGLPRNLFRLNDVGFTVGGPVIIPKVYHGRDKLYFFVSQEYQHQLSPQGTRNVTVPTAAERAGDFSNSVDGNGNTSNIYIKDPLSALPCTSRTGAGNAGCLPNNIVPAARMTGTGGVNGTNAFGPGLALLKMFPLPNVANACSATGGKGVNPSCISGYNFQSQVSGVYPRREDLIRIDYNVTNNQRIFGHWIWNKNTQDLPYGTWILGDNLPFGDIIYENPGHSWAGGHTWTINPTMTNEFNIGSTFNRILIDASGKALTRTGSGSSLPLLYPSAVQEDLLPYITFGGKVSNGPVINQGNNGASPFINHNTTMDITDALSKVWNRHTLKFGMYLTRSWKDQTSFGAFDGSYNFADTTQNPYDTGYAFSNALFGVYNQFQQAANMINGQYRYWNLELFAQDTWKITPRLTLDYGIRSAWVQPQYDASLQAATFVLSKFDASKAPRLYQPVLSASCPATATGPATASTKCGYDSVTNSYVLSNFIGFVVPNSGSLTNGVFQGGQGGVSNYLQDGRPLQWGPRVGLAWNPNMFEQRFVVRVGGGIYYDRFQGNRVFDFVRNPPLGLQPVMNYGYAQDIKPGGGFVSPPSLYAADPPGKIPMTMAFQFGIQTKLTHGFVLDTAYVGNLGRHLEDNRNLNYVPYGAYFQPANQDPTVTSSLPGGAAKLNQNFRPLPGFADVTLYEAAATSNFHSLQVTLDKRVGRLFIGAAYTWSKYLTTATGDTNYFRVDQYTHMFYYGPSGNDRRHNLALNYVYNIPMFFKSNNNFMKAAFDGWQISGVTRLQSGSPFTPGFSIAGIGSQNITGSSTEGARVAIVPGQNAYVDGDEYHRLNAATFAPPLAPSCTSLSPINCTPRSIGLESGSNFLYGPGLNNFDLSLQKNFKLGKGDHPIELQLRGDAFNVFNHTQFTGYNSSVTFSVLSPTASNPYNTINANTYQNGQFGAMVNGVFTPAITPSNLYARPDGTVNNINGFGTVSGARDPRILQMYVRIRF